MATLRTRLGAIGVVSGLLLAMGTAGAHAAPPGQPSPDSGPAAGGTVVTVPLPAGETLTQLRAGGLHTVALGSNGRVYTWGAHGEGQLGTESVETILSHLPVPADLPDDVSIAQIDAGSYHALALTGDGELYSWGGNEAGQVGNGSLENQVLPALVPIPGDAALQQVDAGEYYSVALAADGSIYGWGANESGQLGDGTTESALTPVAAQLPEGVNFTQVSAGSRHTLALADDGTAWAWGFNAEGQLGNGSTAHSGTPVEVTMPAGVRFTAVSSGGHHSLALGDDGKVYSWGHNWRGQLGTGNSVSSSIPVQAELPSGLVIESVEAGTTHSVALAADGTAYGWGENRDGQIGSGATGVTQTPVKMVLPEGVTFATLGTWVYHSVGIDATGHAYAWGDGDWGQLGNGTYENHYKPFPVRMGVTVSEVAFGGVAGTDLSSGTDGVSVTTPAHAPGPVAVTVHAVQMGAPLPVVEYPDGFTYLAPDVAPEITDPASLTVTAGDDAAFTVTASGTPAPTIAWEQSTDGGATWAAVGDNVTVTEAGESSTATLSAKLADDGLLLRGVATNSVAAVSSSAAKLTVVAAPTVSDPESVNVEAGKTASFSVTVTGQPAPAVVWEQSADGGSTWNPVGENVTVSTEGENSSLTLTATTSEQGLSFRATARNAAGSATSAAATLTVFVTPSISDPKSVTVEEGGEASFSVAAAGLPAPTIAWEHSVDGGKTWLPVGKGMLVSGSGENSTLTLTAGLAHDGLLVRAVATSAEGRAVSAPATLTVTERTDPGKPDPEKPGPVKPGPEKPGPADPEPGDSSLAESGAGSSPVVIATVAAVLAAVGIGAALLAARARRRKG